MAGVWVPKAQIQLANDLVTASLVLDEDSSSRAAIQAIANVLISEAVAADPTLAANVSQAAVAAVGVELGAAGVFHGVRPVTRRHGRAISIPYGGKRTWLQAMFNGNPPPESAAAVANAGTSALFTQGAVIRRQMSRRRPYAITFEIGRKIVAYFDWSGNLRSGDGTLLAGKASSTKQWIAVGDSTTFGADLTTPLVTRWSTLLSSLLGIGISNFGQPSARADEITARSGALRFTATVGGGTIPAAGGSVVLTDLSVDPLRGTNVASFEVELVTPAGQRIRGTLYRTDGAVRTFSRSSAGGAVTVASVDVDSYTGRTWRDSPVIFAMGINDENLLVGNGGTRTVDQVKGWYRDFSSTLRDEWFHWGLLDRGAGEASGTVNGDYIRALEAWFRLEHGTRWIPVRPYLASARALSDATLYQPGFVASTQSLADVAAGTVPIQFRATDVSPGTVHLNPLGHQLQAAFIASWLRQHSRYAAGFTVAA